MKERTLFIGAHADDLEFTAGGTVAALIKMGQTVDQVIMTDSNGQGKSSRRFEEAKAGMKIIGGGRVYDVGNIEGFKDGNIVDLVKPMAQALLSVLDQAAKEGIIYTRIISFSKYGYTGHADHKAVAKVASRIFKSVASIKEYWQVDMSPQEKKLWDRDFEPTGGYFVHIPKVNVFNHNAFDISETFEQKIKSLKAHKTQLSNGVEMHIKRIKELPKIEYFKVIRKNIYTRK